MKRICLSALLLLTAGLGVAGAEPTQPRAQFANEAGWIWHLQPQAAGWQAMSTAGLSMRLDELKGDQLLLTLAHSTELERDVVRFRPVAFNAARQRFEFKSDSGSGTAGAALKGYLIDLKTIPRDRIEFIGIEKLTKDNFRDVIAPAARQKLKDRGVQALPFPRLGERYEFELTTLDGRPISSRDLRGKVVLLDFWAKWCGPCMGKMPTLKETYRKLSPQGFTILGLNHDFTPAAATRVVRELGLDWPNVLASVDGEQRELWMAATGTTTLPRLLLIDRSGILRADVSPEELHAAIEKLMSSE